MDDSQSSDFFSETGTSIYDVSTIDEESYQTIFNRIQKCLVAKSANKNVRTEEICKTLLSDCRDCTDQSFNIIISLVENSTIDIEKVCKYIENVVQILQILSNFIKNIIEKIPLSCCTVKTFPTCTGTIIELIFSHCKDSEFIYENHINLVEKQLKELFRCCHELQLTYLMTLQKHFLFDLTIKDEQEILLEALHINLKIGEIVQSLDVKTMAEQWKAYIVICEKYSAFLLDKNTYNNCTQLLASSIYKNITTVTEAEEKDKVIVRSLKVASFSLKILLKICIIFKGATNVDYDCIIQLLCSIKLCDTNYHELMSNKSEISSLMCGHLSAPSEALILQLANEELFIENILSLNINDYKHSNYLGYILMLISIMKAMMKLQKNITGLKNQIIDRVFYVIKKCHIWFNMGLKMTSAESSRTFNNLYEYFLMHTTAFISTFTSEEYVLVEKMFIESFLATDFYSSMFSANLWLLLCRMKPTQLHINSLHNLIKVYQVLETQTAFSSSLQEVNLNYTITQLFKTLKCNEKSAFYKTYNLQEDKNIGLWCALEISSLPENISIVAEKMVIEKLLEINRDVWENQRNIDKLIKYLLLASTCVFMEHYPELEDLLTTIWCKFCISCYNRTQKNLNLNSMGHFILLKNLTSLTNQYKNKFLKSDNVLKILNVMSKILQMNNAELSIIIFETFCELLYHSDYDSNLENLLINTLRNFSNECDIQTQIFTTLLTNNEIYDFVVPIIHKNPVLGEMKRQFDSYKEKQQNIIKWQEQLEMASDYNFEHKCIENELSEEKPESNFEMDFESLFEDEPASKKAKYDINVENLISAIETSTNQLGEIKDIALCGEYKDRLKSVCEKIRNIVS